LVLMALWVLELVLALGLVLMLGRYLVVATFGSTKDGHMWGPHARWRKPPGAALGAEAEAGRQAERGASAGKNGG